MNILSIQYELVKESREIVFEYCEHFSKRDYLNGLEGFGKIGKKSVRDLQVHVANVYLHWLCAFVRQKEVEYFNAEEVKEIKDVHELYKKVNACVSEFLVDFLDIKEPIEGKFPGREEKIKVTPVELMTHVMTHEFHHKGQILMIGRMLGYTPPDADIIRA